jgi:hypothetical protein
VWFLSAAASHPQAAVLPLFLPLTHVILCHVMSAAASHPQAAVLPLSLPLTQVILCHVTSAAASRPQAAVLPSSSAPTCLATRCLMQGDSNTA